MEILAAVALGVAAFVAWTGGWRGEVLGLTLSLRTAARPLLMALALAVARWFLAGSAAARLSAFSEACARVVAGALLIAGILGWATHLSPYLGGADSYGYVSAAERLRTNDLIHREPLAALLPYPNGISAASPLGYIPSARLPDANVPAYPLGLPALMAVAWTIAGPRAPFFISFAMGLVLVGVCAWMVYRWTRDATLTLAASAAVIVHPVVFAYAIQPMSDVPAAAFYLLAAVLLLDREAGLKPRHHPIGLVRAALAGTAATAAVLIRPALLFGAAALALITLLSGPRRIARLIVFGVILAGGGALQAYVQWFLYGSPTANGYGPAGVLFDVGNLPANARSYAYWIVVMHGAVWLAGVMVALVTLEGGGARAMIVAPLVGAVIPYAIYRTYDHWETLRFILPLLIVLTLASVAGLFRLSRKVLPRAGTWLALALTLVMVIGWARWLEREHVLQLALAEQRFSLAAELVARVTPERAVILASLHSGSVRYYAHRQTLDWAKIPKGQLSATVGVLRDHDLPVYLMMDGDEERAQFESRHGRVVDEEGWLPSGQQRDVRLFQARSR